ncbi:hypothetical protein H0W26_00460, partial [Candidatus Dependentiae bacterium]|nr:hypothetical protein [Candidatus Dependentiae bacterium]
MKELKRSIFQLFLGAEIIVVTFLYLVGSGGLLSVKTAYRQNTALLG